MITSEDKCWLSTSYPGLVPSASGIAGTVPFTATYNEALDRFLILSEGVVDDVGGVKLSCSYRIRIEERRVQRYSSLPAVYVDGIKPIAARHFDQDDNSACLCSPIEEIEFLHPRFDFRRFLEQLVIPFLYGQNFYSEYRRWPWDEYAHGATGLLESFSECEIGDSWEVRKFLSTLARDWAAWPHIRAALQQEKLNGNLVCFCRGGDKIRRCHPRALAGLQRLHERVKDQSIPLPNITTGNSYLDVLEDMLERLPLQFDVPVRTREIKLKIKR